MTAKDLKEFKSLLYRVGEFDAIAFDRHIDDLCQSFWTDLVDYFHNEKFDFSDLVASFPHYKQGILDARKKATI